MYKMKEMLKKRGWRRIGGKRGFTLIELLIVMSIIAILVAIVVMSLTGFIGGGQKAAARADQRSLQTAVLAYYATEGVWPCETQPTDGNPQDIAWDAWVDNVPDPAVNRPGLAPTFVLEKPASDTLCGWEVRDDGVVGTTTGGDCPGLPDVPNW
ncbi:MAG: type II secretion system protein [Dehalococcoidia bacterium]|nr:MAG: type II secretion system protein [Dehalococcoidia bacterium]